MTGPQIRHIFTQEGLDPDNINDIRRKLRVIQMDNAWHFINTRDDKANQIVEINYDTDGSLGIGYIKVKERIRDFWRVHYKPFDVIQGLSFATGEIAPNTKNGIKENISPLSDDERYDIVTSNLSAELLLSK